MTKYCVTYRRVSSEEQVSNFSLDNQKDYCFEHAKKNGYQVLKDFVDEGKTAKNTNRRGLIDLLDYCTENKGKLSALIVYKYDRLSRDTYQALGVRHNLAKKSIEVISCTEPSGVDPTSKFIQTILFASAQFDNDVKSVRTLDGMRKRFEAGLPIGKAPLGYLNIKDDSGRPVIGKDEEQFDLIKQCWKEFASGTHTLETMTERMNELGIVTKIGKRRKAIMNQHVSRIFRNKFYAGYIVNDRWGETKGIHEPMISEDIFYKVQSILDGKSNKTAPHQRRHPDFPLRWFVKCGECNTPLTAGWSKGRSKKYPYYYCNSGKHKSPSIPKEDFENEFISYLESLTPKLEFVKLFSEIVKEKYKGKIKIYEKQQKLNKRKVKDVKYMISKLTNGHMRGIYSDNVYKQEYEKLENDLEVAKTVLAESKLDKLDIDSMTALMEKFLSNLAKPWGNGTLEQKQIIFGSIFPENLHFDSEGFRTATLAPFLEPFKGVNHAKDLIGVI